MVMNNYLILILGQMKYYSENSHDRPQNFGETCVIYPKLINMEKKYVLGQFFFSYCGFFDAVQKNSNGGELRNSVGKLLEGPQDCIWGSDGGFRA